MKKLTAIFLALVFLFSSIVIVGPASQQASADTTVLDGDSADGWIGWNGATYSQSTTQTGGFLGYYDSTPDVLYRDYLSFDISSASGMVINSVSLTIWMDPRQGSSSMLVNVYLVDYGTLDSGDWDAYLTGSLVAQFAASTSTSYYNIDIDPHALAGKTTLQLQFKLNDETQLGRAWILGHSEADNYQIYRHMKPYLTLSMIEHTYVTIYMDDAQQYQFYTVPFVQKYNSTHEAVTYTFDTWANVSRAIIHKGGPNWTLFAVSPYCLATDVSMSTYLNNTVDGATYRVIYLRPLEAYSTIHVAMFLSSTGEGLPFEMFRVQYCLGVTWNNTTAIDITTPNFIVASGTYTMAVMDYFGNVITTCVFIANSEQEYVSIPLDIYSFKVFNQQEDFVRFRIYYNNTGAPLTFFNAPMEPVERFLRPGPYTIVVTYYPAGIAADSEYFNITVSDAEFLMVAGMTISRVVSDVAGVAAMQTVITDLVTPDMVFIRQNMPTVPTESVIYIHPWSVVTASTASNASGTSLAFHLPRPNVAGVAYTILSDKLFISGNYNTEIWINSTAGVNLFHSTALQSAISLNGENITIQSNGTISVNRETEFRAEDLFYYAYYTTTKKYEVTLTLNNSMASMDFSAVDWFVGFPENRSIELASVRVQDLDNAVFLVSGLNYDVTSAGVRMAFDSLAAGETRSFKFTFYDANASSGQGIPIAYADTKTKTGDDTYLTTASWTNSYTAAYDGALTIRLDFQHADLIDVNSVIVTDKTNSRQLSPDEWYMVGNVITISHVQAGVGGVLSYDVLFQLDYANEARFDVTAPLFMVGSFPISPLLIGSVLIIVSGAFAVTGRITERRWPKFASGLFILVFSVVAFVSLLSYNGAI